VAAGHLLYLLGRPREKGDDTEWPDPGSWQANHLGMTPRARPDIGMPSVVPRHQHTKRHRRQCRSADIGRCRSQAATSADIGPVESRAIGTAMSPASCDIGMPRDIGAGIAEPMSFVDYDIRLPSRPCRAIGRPRPVGPTLILWLRSMSNLLGSGTRHRPASAPLSRADCLRHSRRSRPMSRDLVRRDTADIRRCQTVFENSRRDWPIGQATMA
jgi:hypothetical protein